MLACFPDELFTDHLLTLSESSTLQFSPPRGELRLELLVGWLVSQLKVLENGSKDFSDFLHEVWGP